MVTMFLKWLTLNSSHITSPLDRATKVCLTYLYIYIYIYIYMYIRIAFFIELRLRVSRLLRSLANYRPSPLAQKPSNNVFASRDPITPSNTVKYHPSSNTLISTEHWGGVRNKYMYIRIAFSIELRLRVSRSPIIGYRRKSLVGRRHLHSCLRHSCNAGRPTRDILRYPMINLYV